MLRKKIKYILLPLQTYGFNYAFEVEEVHLS